VNCRRWLRVFLAVFVFAGVSAAVHPKSKQETSASETTLARLIELLHDRAKKLENSSGMRSSFESFTSAYKISPQSISYSDFVIVRLLYEATRDAGFWNMHWTITNMPPNSDQVWRQWKAVQSVSPQVPTASAECDELSALYAFLVERALFDFFVQQIDKYAGASDSTLQQIRYLREGVFLKDWSAETAASNSLDRKKSLESGPAEDAAAFQNFANDMRVQQ